MRYWRTLLLLLSVSLGLVTAASAQAACHGAATTPGTTVEGRTATLCLLNIQRRVHGLPALHENPRLGYAATSYSRTMVRDGFFDHVAPGGMTLQQRLSRVGYAHWSQIGENIAWGSGSLATPTQIVASWMRSPPHRANILNRSFSDIGIGIAHGAPMSGVGSSAAVYTTDFGRAL